MTSDGTALEDLSRLAALFEGAWPYLELIAACNGIADPPTPGLSRPTGPATSW